VIYCFWYGEFVVQSAIPDLGRYFDRSVEKRLLIVVGSQLEISLEWPSSRSP
jgi:hypothetical protein